MNKVMENLPRFPADFTTGWLEDCLNQEKDSLAEITCTSIGNGHLAGSYRLELSGDNWSGPASVVVKCTHPSEKNRWYSHEVWVYRREVNWYRELAGLSKIRCPACYSVSVSDDYSEYVLVLEDCSPATVPDQIAGAAPEVILKGLGEIALLHAPFMNKKELLNKDYLLFDHSFRDERVKLMRWAWPLFKERFQHRINEELFKVGDEFTDNFEKFIYRETEDNTVLHGDARLDNLLIKDNGDVVVLDWQTLSVGHPMCDVAYFVSASFPDPAVRRDNEEKLFNHYVDALRAEGCKVDPDAFWLEYRIQVFSGFVQAVIACMSVEQTERGDEMFAVMAERALLQAIDLDSVSAL